MPEHLYTVRSLQTIACHKIAHSQPTEFCLLFLSVPECFQSVMQDTESEVSSWLSLTQTNCDESEKAEFVAAVDVDFAQRRAVLSDSKADSVGNLLGFGHLARVEAVLEGLTEFTAELRAHL